MSTELEEDVLRSLRRIMRSIDLHSRQLATAYGLTGPQLVSLRVIAEQGPLSPSRLARLVSLSQGTITGIVDRLAARQLVTRERTQKDRRVVMVEVTDAGRALIATAPSPLQERFVDQLHALSHEEQSIIRLTLGKIVRMMGGEAIDAAPVLASEAQIQGPHEVSAATPLTQSEPTPGPAVEGGGRGEPPN